MNARHAVDFFDPPAGMSVHPIAGRCPIGSGFVKILTGDQPVDFQEMVANARRLTQPPRLFSVQGGGDRQQVGFPTRVETSALFPPLQTPIPNLREDHHRECRAAQRALVPRSD